MRTPLEISSSTRLPWIKTCKSMNYELSESHIVSPSHIVCCWICSNLTLKIHIVTQVDIAWNKTSPVFNFCYWRNWKFKVIDYFLVLLTYILCQVCIHLLGVGLDTVYSMSDKTGIVCHLKGWGCICNKEKLRRKEAPKKVLNVVYCAKCCLVYLHECLCDHRAVSDR